LYQGLYDPGKAAGRYGRLQQHLGFKGQGFAQLRYAIDRQLKGLRPLASLPLQAGAPIPVAAGELVGVQVNSDKLHISLQKMI
jgi:hypothetical protein